MTPRIRVPSASADATSGQATDAAEWAIGLQDMPTVDFQRAVVARIQPSVVRIGDKGAIALLDLFRPIACG